VHHTTLPTTDLPALKQANLLTLALPLAGVLLMLLYVPYHALRADIWSDEAFTVSYTRDAGPAALLEDVRKNEETPPLYFLATWLWARAFGADAVPVRAFTIVCGAAAVALVARLAWHRLGPAAAVVSCAVMALAPLLHRLLPEARGYVATMLAAVLCIIAFERLWREPERRGAQALYTLSAAACFLTSYFTVALLAAQWVLWLAQLRDPAARRRRLRDWAFMHLVGALLVAPWLPGLAYQLAISPAITDSPRVGAHLYPMLLVPLLMGFSPSGPWRLIWALAAVAGLVLAAIAVARLRQPPGGLVLRAFVAPTLAAWPLMAALNVALPRYTLLLLPGLALTVGAGFDARLRRRPAEAVGLAALLCLGMAACLVVRADLPHSDWASLSGVLAREADPAGDVVIVHPPYDLRVFTEYYRGPALPILGARNYDDFYIGEGHNFTASWTPAEAVAATRSYHRIWRVQDHRYNGAPALTLPFRELARWHAGALELVLYEGPAPRQ